MSKPQHFFLLFGTIWASFSNPGDGVAEETTYRLRYQFRPNQFVHYEEVHRMNIHTQKGEAVESVRNRKQARKHFRVVTVHADGSAVLEPVVDRVEMWLQFGMEEPISWNSAESQEVPPRFASVAAALGKPQARLKVTPTGRLNGVIPLQPARRDEAARRTDPARAKSDADINFLVEFPEDSVRIGGEWNDEFTVAVNEPTLPNVKRDIRVQRTYTLRAVEEGIAKIDLVTSILTHVADGNIRAQLIQRAPSGSIEFDLERGVIVSRRLIVDKQEVGIHGPNSLMHARTTHEERWIERPAVAQRTAPIGPPAAPTADLRKASGN